MAFWPFEANPEYRRAWEAHQQSAISDPAGKTDEYARTSVELDEAADRTPFYRMMW